jgi:ATP-dependent DNA ligase
MRNPVFDFAHGVADLRCCIHRGAVAARPAENALIDGEAVAFLPGGHSDFGALRTKAGRAATGTSA